MLCSMMELRALTDLTLLCVASPREGSIGACLVLQNSTHHVWPQLITMAMRMQSSCQVQHTEDIL